MRNFIACCFLIVSIFGQIMAMDAPEAPNTHLIIGCRPVDENLIGTPLERFDFMDFQAYSRESFRGQVPNFHHIDMNDTGANISKKLSDFSRQNPGRYAFIIFDWGTFDKVHRDGAWSDLSNLLQPGGQLVLPVTSYRCQFLAGNPIGVWVLDSAERAQELIDQKLNGLFSQIQKVSFEELPQDPSFDLLRRQNYERGITGDALTFNPAIIIATK